VPRRTLVAALLVALAGGLALWTLRSSQKNRSLAPAATDAAVPAQRAVAPPPPPAAAPPPSEPAATAAAAPEKVAPTVEASDDDNEETDKPIGNKLRWWLHPAELRCKESSPACGGARCPA